MIAAVVEFFKALFDINDSRVSYGRVMSLLLSASVLMWDTVHMAVVLHYDWRLPVSIAPLPIYPPASELLGQAAFITVFYGVTRIAAVFGNEHETGTPKQ